MDLEGLIRPMVESAGLELVEVSLAREQGRRILRVTLDREGGLDLDTIAGAGDDGVTIATESGERTVAYEDIASARTVFDWGVKR